MTEDAKSGKSNVKELLRPMLDYRADWSVVIRAAPTMIGGRAVSSYLQGRKYAQIRAASTWLN